MARAGLVVLVAACLAVASAHPYFEGPPQAGVVWAGRADSPPMAAKPEKYNRYYAGVINGIGTHGGVANNARTTRVMLYLPPIVEGQIEPIPGWDVSLYPCESKGKLQCDGWTVMDWQARTWEDAVNNTAIYSWYLGLALGCECEESVVCEAVEDANGDPKFKIWVPWVQYLYVQEPEQNHKTGSLTPNKGVFWTFNADVQKKGALLGAEPLLNFEDDSLYESGEFEGSFVSGLGNGKRAPVLNPTDYTGCEFALFNGKTYAPKLPTVSIPAPATTTVAPAPATTTVAPAAAPAPAPVSAPAKAQSAPSEAEPESEPYKHEEESSDVLVVVALAISVISLLVGAGAIVFAFTIKNSVANAVHPAATKVVSP